MKKKFKTKKNKKITKITLLFLIYISFSITYNTLYNHYIKKLSTEQLIEKIIKDSKNNIQKESILDKYKNPEYILKTTLNLDLTKEENKTQEVINNQDIKNNKVFIYNTHDTEKYNDNRFNHYNIIPDVKLVSNMLEEKLKDKGISTYVERTHISNVLKHNNWTYSKSYQASRILIEENIKNNNYSLIIDLHRDSSILTKTYLEHNNKSYAKVLFVIGTEYDSYESNLNLATKLNKILEEKIPGISRGIIKKGGAGVNGIYNQDLSPNLLLIEVGGQYNKIEDLNNTTELLSEAILILLEGD